MLADTKLKEAQFQVEVRKTALSIADLIVAGMGAGAALLAGMIALAKWYTGH